MTEQPAASFYHRHYSGQSGREQTDSREKFFIDWQNKREEQHENNCSSSVCTIECMGSRLILSVQRTDAGSS